MQPVRQVVMLSGGSVTLKAWGADVADGYLVDRLRLTVLIGSWAESGLSPDDMTADVTELESWVLTLLDRLADASALSELPRPLSYSDLLTLMSAMWELNDLEEQAGKLKALMSRAQREVLHLKARQGHPTAP